MTTGFGVRAWIIAGPTHAHVEPKARSFAGDVGLCNIQQGRMHGKMVTFDARFGGEIGGLLKRFDERRATIGIALIIKRIDPNPKIAGIARFGQAKA